MPFFGRCANKRELMMNWITFAKVTLLAAVLIPGSAFAANTVLSGVFDGSETRTQPLAGTCGGTDPLAYQEIGPVTISAQGVYTIKDAFNFNGVDVSALLYLGAFNPASPETNLVTPNGVDVAESIELDPGAYTLVVQQWCQNVEGAWAITFSGPGEVESASARDVPEATSGVFSDTDPTVATDCGTTYYQESGPVQVATSGSYYYTDVSIEFDVDMCLQVFTAPFDPANPEANRVGSDLDDFGVVELEAGRDYYFLVQPLATSTTLEGEYFYVLAPPAPFRINKALAGSWYYPQTNGQGFFIDVFDKSNQLFLAWFTFDLERPPEGTTAMIGEPGHRWMTAIGPFSGDTADLTIYWSSGMVFDSPNPPVEQAPDGSMTVRFNGCTSGTVDYDLGTNSVTGQVPIQILAPDMIEMCESLTVGPGMPGPL